MSTDNRKHINNKSVNGYINTTQWEGPGQWEGEGQGNGQENTRTQGRMIEKNIIGEFRVLNIIGKGNFSKVYIGIHIPTQEKVAIKIMSKANIKDPSELSRIDKEILIHSRLRHNNITQLYSYINTDANIYWINEYCSGGELFNYIVNNKKLSENEALRIYQQLISGLEYLHKQKIVHRDLKPENLWFNSKHEWKITDFGLSNIYNDYLDTACGSPCYAAPEMIRGKKYIGSAVDIWSSGIVLYTMLVGFVPFEDDNQSMLFQKICKGKYTVPNYLSEQCKDLLAQILVTNPKKRYTFDDIKHHPWFTGINTVMGVNWFSLSPGLFVKEDVIPWDEDLIHEMVMKYNFQCFDIIKDVWKNKMSTVSTTYYLWWRKKIRNGNKSVSDVSPTSELFWGYCKRNVSKLAYWKGDVDQIVKHFCEEITGRYREKNEKVTTKRNYVNCGCEQILKCDLDCNYWSKRKDLMQNGNERVSRNRLCQYVDSCNKKTMNVNTIHYMHSNMKSIATEDTPHVNPNKANNKFQPLITEHTVHTRTKNYSNGGNDWYKKQNLLLMKQRKKEFNFNISTPNTNATGTTPTRKCSYTEKPDKNSRAKSTDNPLNSQTSSSQKQKNSTPRYQKRRSVIVSLNPQNIVVNTNNKQSTSFLNCKEINNNNNNNVSKPWSSIASIKTSFNSPKQPSLQPLKNTRNSKNNYINKNPFNFTKWSFLRTSFEEIPKENKFNVNYRVISKNYKEMHYSKECNRTKAWTRKNSKNGNNNIFQISFYNRQLGTSCIGLNSKRETPSRNNKNNPIEDNGNTGYSEKKDRKNKDCYQPWNPLNHSYKISINAKHIFENKFSKFINKHKSTDSSRRSSMDNTKWTQGYKNPHLLNYGNRLWGKETIHSNMKAEESSVPKKNKTNSFQSSKTVNVSPTEMKIKNEIARINAECLTICTRKSLKKITTIIKSIIGIHIEMKENNNCINSNGNDGETAVFNIECKYSNKVNSFLFMWKIMKSTKWYSCFIITPKLLKGNMWAFKTLFDKIKNELV